MRSTRRIAAIATVLAILISPIVATSASAAVPQIIGTPRSTAWIDASVNAEATVNAAYSSTLQGPNDGGPFAVSIEDGPAWLSASIDQSTQDITIFGTPTTADASVSFTVRLSASNGENTYYIDFEGLAVLPDTTPTSTDVSTPYFSHYSTPNVSATVSSGVAGGTVDFYFGTHLVGDDVPVGSSGIASFYGPVDESFVGQSWVVRAEFSGDATYSASTSTSDPSVYIHGDRVVSGYFVRNGVGTAGEHIRLLTAAGLSTSYAAVTGVAGYFAITLDGPASLVDVTAKYVVEAADSGYFHSSAIGVESPTTFSGATATGDADWTEWVNIYEYRDPTWTDQTLSQPRMGQSYSDGVVADPRGAGSITYTATGDLPSWLTLSSTTGALTSSGPTEQAAHTFTLRATSDFGYIEKQFTLEAGDAGVAPTFTDTTIADLTVGTELTDEVTASGDPTIVYSSTALPPGLTLDPSSGELTGTPTTAGDYVVTFTAHNEFGDDTYIWEPTVAEKPEIDLVLNFAAGTKLEDAETEIGADGLQVGSTYTLDMHSTPVRLYTGTVDLTGGFTWLVSLPADTPVGAHELILTGVAPDGTVMTAHAWFTLLPNGTIGAISYSGAIPFRLAFSGSEPLLPLGIASALLVAGYLIQRRGAASKIRAVRVP